MKTLSSYINTRRDQYNGSSKELDKLLNKIELMVHAPTTKKHTKRMESFARNQKLVNFIDDSLNNYFNQNNHFLNEASEPDYYDVIQTWYLFSMLVYSDKLEQSVIQIISKMAKTRHPDLFIARRVLNLCENPVYDDQLKKVETIFANLNKTTKVYIWMKSLDVIPPQNFEWQLTFRLVTKPSSEMHKKPNNLHLTVECREPKGDGKSFRIEVSDRDRQISAQWDDFSTNNYIQVGKNQIELSSVPQLQNLKEMVCEFEEIFGLEFEMKYSFQYFTRGFKNKNHIQKWLSKN